MKKDNKIKVYLDSYDGLYEVKVISFFRDDLFKSIIKAKVVILNNKGCGHLYRIGEEYTVTANKIVKIVCRGYKYESSWITNVTPKQLGITVQD